MLANIPDPSEKSSQEWNASVYHSIAHPQFSWGSKLLNRLGLSGSETVLDAGCGSGLLTAELLMRLPFGRVIAVDQSKEMLQAANEYLLPRFGQRVTLLHADLLALQMNETVDLVFSTASFHWILDHPLLFRNLYQVLKPNGKLIAQCGGGSNLAHLLQRTSQLMATEPYAPFFAKWSNPWEYSDEVTTANRLSIAGFTDIETNLEAAPTLLANAQEYRDFLSHIVLRTHLIYLPNDHMRSKFISTLTIQAAEDDPPFFLDFWRLNMQARRPQ